MISLKFESLPGDSTETDHSALRLKRYGLIKFAEDVGSMSIECLVWPSGRRTWSYESIKCLKLQSLNCPRCRCVINLAVEDVPRILDINLSRLFLAKLLVDLFNCGLSEATYIHYIPRV